MEELNSKAIAPGVQQNLIGMHTSVAIMKTAGSGQGEVYSSDPSKARVLLHSSLCVSNCNSNGRWGPKGVILGGQHYRYVRI